MPGKRKAKTELEKGAAPKIQKLEEFKPEEIVWCDLGQSYGWWPGIVTNTKVIINTW